jgi:PAS domain S-box-containing protein
MGLDAAQVVGRHVREVLGEAMYAAYLPVAERLFGGEALRWEGWMDYRGRGARYYEQFLLPFARNGGAVEAIITFGRDVTELKQREEELSSKLDELQATQALKAAIVDHALAALVSTDAEGRIVEFNPAAEAMFGRKRADVLWRLVGEVIIPDRHRAAHDAGMARMAQGGPPRIMGKRVEMSALRADGSEFPVEMVLWRTEVAGTAYYTASMVDLAERQNAAREIERQRDALRQSEKLTAMGSLLAGVAHELNNPLAIVLGRAALLEEKAAGQSAIEGDARRIREAAERCARIVRTFLGMARQQRPERGPVAINDVVTAALDITAYSVRTSNIDVALDLAADIPLILADADQLHQVILNLIVNAQQALQERPAPRRILATSRFDAASAQVHASVADNGPGIPEHLRARVFEPYFTTKPTGIGTGVGLAVSLAIVEAHGGTLTVDCPADGGTVFNVALPVVCVDAAGADAAPATVPRMSTDRRKILIVDDEADIRETLAQILIAVGHRVATAGSGRDALDRLAGEHYDVILTDMRMPDLDGRALYQEIERRWPRRTARVVFVTGDTLSPSLREFVERSDRPVIEKPFMPSDVRRIVAELVTLGERSARF